MYKFWVSYSFGSGILFRDGAFGLLAALLFLPEKKLWWKFIIEYAWISQQITHLRRGQVDPSSFSSSTKILFVFYDVRSLKHQEISQDMT